MFGNAEANREARACKSLAPVRKKINKHTLTHTYTHTHTHTHARTHAHTHTRTQTHTQTHTHTHTGSDEESGTRKGGVREEGGGGVARLGGVLHFSLSFCAQGEKERK